jgi:cell pole-organizing protein PopZ
MGKQLKKAASFTKSLIKDPVGQIGKNVAKLTGLGSIAGASKDAADMASQDAAAQRAQFEAQTKALADQQAKAMADANAKLQAQNDLNNISGTDNVVKVEQGANDTTDLGMGTATTKKRKGNTLSSSLGL